MADVAILIPVLRRPHRAMPVATSALDNTPNARVVFIGTAGDVEELNAVAAVQAEYGRDLIQIEVISPNRIGDYAVKINHGYRTTSEEFLLFGADDLAFHDGWFERAVIHMSDEVAVVGTQDLANRRVLRGEHSTHPLVARWYIDQAGTIDERGKALHEGYPHEFVDDEFIGTAIARDVFVFENRSVIEHLHPAVGKAPMDDLYRGEPRRMTQGRILFHRRRTMWMSRS